MRRRANGTPYVDEAILDRFNVALRCPVIPPEADVERLAFYEYTP
jgi:hypothetical protein